MSLTVTLTAERGNCCASCHLSLSLKLMLKFISPEQEGVLFDTLHSIQQVSTVSLHLYPRQHVKSDYRDESTTCSGGKQGKPVNAATLTMSVGTIFVLMPWVNIR